MVKPQKPTTTTKTETEMADEVTSYTPLHEPTIAPTTAAEAPKAEAPHVPTLPDVSMISDDDLNAMLKVLRSEVRRRESEREASRPKVGSKVRILRSRPKYAGKVGTAVVVRKSRCFVAVPEIDSPAYLLISDVEVIER